MGQDGEHYKNLHYDPHIHVLVHGGKSSMEGKKLRRQRRSKKSKRSWRKHTDVQDVEEYLQDRQREEIIG